MNAYRTQAIIPVDSQPRWRIITSEDNRFHIQYRVRFWFWSWWKTDTGFEKLDYAISYVKNRIAEEKFVPAVVWDDVTGKHDACG